MELFKFWYGVNMNKIIIALGLCISFNALAIVDGTSIDWSKQDNFIRLYNENSSGYCSGVVVGGKYVITAAHCFNESNVLERVENYQGNVEITDYTLHPNFIGDVNGALIGEDITVVKLNSPMDYSGFNPIANLNSDPFVYGEMVEIFGFGKTERQLYRADMMMTDWRDCDLCNTRNEFTLNAEMVNDSHTTGGDSGGAWINESGEIVSIHQGSSLISNSGNEWRETYSTNLHYGKDFIIENIDAWHYPTLAEVKGRTAITVQSLHQNDISDTAYTQGNITLIPEDSTCVTQGSITPFEQCTYVIEGSSGEEGQLFLSDSEVIHINKPVEDVDPEDPDDNTGGSGSSSGGSLGFSSLLLAALITWRRKSQKHR